jgi:hypothetical protein
MSTTKVYNGVAKLPIMSTFLMFWGCIELHRVSKGTHPYWSPRPGSVRDIAARVAKGDAVGLGDASVTFTNLNGMPIPTLAALSTPSREQ